VGKGNAEPPPTRNADGEPPPNGGLPGAAGNPAVRFQFQPGENVHGNLYRDFSPRAYLSGLSASTQQISASAGSIASSIGSMIGTAVGGPELGAIVGSAISAATAIAVAIEGLFKGCGQTCIEASRIADQVSSLLVQNAQNYVHSPVRTQSMQVAALQVFDNAWAQLVQACNSAQLAQAGQNCISDRQRGACKWKTSPGGWVTNTDGTCTYTWAGAAGSGTTCWDWFTGMRDPIANDPCVIPDSALSSASTSPSASTTATGGGSGSATTGGGVISSSPFSTLTSSVPLPLLLIGGGLLVFMAVSR